MPQHYCSNDQNILIKYRDPVLDEPSCNVTGSSAMAH
jgi:hypothetical protein